VATYGYTRRDKRIERAIQFILKEQERMEAGLAVGCELPLRHLPGAARPRAIGMWNHEPEIQHGGGWDPICTERGWRLGRELPQLRRSTTRGVGVSTPSQTAWGILGLLSAVILAATRLPRRALAVGTAARAMDPGTRAWRGQDP